MREHSLAGGPSSSKLLSWLRLGMTAKSELACMQQPNHGGVAGQHGKLPDLIGFGRAWQGMTRDQLLPRSYSLTIVAAQLVSNRRHTHNISTLASHLVHILRSEFDPDGENSSKIRAKERHIT